jgi:integrase
VSSRRKPTPSYLVHQQSGRARAVWTDPLGIRHQKLLPGAFDSAESRTAFARLQLELETSPTATAADAISIGLAEVLSAYLDHAEAYYRTPDGTPTSEVQEIKLSIRPVRELYGQTLAAEFGPRSLSAVQKHMIGLGWCRTLINRRIDRVKRAMKWAVAQELVAPGVYEALRTLPGLRRGRTEARESERVKPVAAEVVEATLPHLPPHVRVMVQLLMHTGMRPAEVCEMTPNTIDRTGRTWAYRPAHHKTAHHGKERVVPLGPKGRAVLAAFLAGRSLDPDAPIFSPAVARDERFAEMRASRKSKVPPSQRDRRKAKPEKLPGDRYHPHAIAHAIRVACEKAFPLPSPLARQEGESRKKWWARLSEAQRAEVRAWRRAHHWHPYQLRHAYATRVRKEHGLEAAQVLLGHSRADVTQVYAERNEALATEVAAKIG